jgi:ABC-type transporter Mla MlaB component
MLFEGELLIQQIPALQGAVLQALDEGTTHFDLSHITECDTAGMQFLVSLIKEGQLRNQPVVLDSPSLAVQEMARQIHLESLLFPELNSVENPHES